MFGSSTAIEIYYNRSKRLARNKFPSSERVLESVRSTALNETKLVLYIIIQMMSLTFI